MNDPTARFATPRVASGAIFIDRDRIFLVHKTYGIHWDLPGGYVDRGESPASACERELREELKLERTVRRLLVLDWAPSDAEGDKILYVFDCGELGRDEESIVFDGTEIDTGKWVAIDDIPQMVIPRLARRLEHAYRAHTSGETIYLENGRPCKAP